MQPPHISGLSIRQAGGTLQGVFLVKKFPFLGITCLFFPSFLTFRLSFTSVTALCGPHVGCLAGNSLNKTSASPIRKINRPAGDMRNYRFWTNFRTGLGIRRKSERSRYALKVTVNIFRGENNNKCRVHFICKLWSTDHACFGDSI